MPDRSTVEITIEAFDSPPSPYGDGVSLTRRISKVLTIGNGDDQSQKIYGVNQSIASGATMSLDLKTDEDRYGTALGAADLVLLFCENVHTDDGGAGGEDIEIRPNASNGFTNLLGASSALKLPLGAFVMVGNFYADQYVITNTNKVLDFVNTDGATAATINLIVMTRS